MQLKVRDERQGVEGIGETVSTGVPSAPRIAAGAGLRVPSDKEPANRFARGGWTDAVEFGPFRLDRDRYVLSKLSPDGTEQEVVLRRKAFDLLSYMVGNAGRIISPEEFFRELWPNVNVQAAGLKGHILQIRNAIGDAPDAPLYVETVRGRGYRFVANVTAPADARPSDEVSAVATSLSVGRDGPLRELDTLLRRAMDREASIGFVTGDPGIGKTTLVEQFTKVAVATGGHVAIAHCLPGSADNDAYYPMLELLAQLARSGVIEDFAALLSAVAPTWLVQLPWLMVDGIGGGARQDVFGTTPHRMMRELCDLLDRVAEDIPLVLVIEDVHWADQPTLDLLNAIAVRRSHSRLLVIATMRVGGDSLSARAARTLCQMLSLYRLAKEINLQPLREQDVDDYLSLLAGGTAPRRLATLLHERSEGNPLFISAMLDHFRARDLLISRDAGWELADDFYERARELPPSLARIIEGEFEKLDPDARSVLLAASICEGRFSGAESHPACEFGEERFEAVCEDLVRTTPLIARAGEMSLPSGRRIQRYAFRHMLFREVVYARMSATKRVSAHLAIGEGMERIFGADLGSVASVLSINFLAAERWDKAIRYLRLVARNAMARFSNREASATLEQALALVGNLPAEKRRDIEVELLEDLARIYAGALDARAFSTYERLLATARSAGRLDVECRALLGLGFALAWTDLDKSNATLSEALTKSAALRDPLAQARIRTFGHGWRSWSVGWSQADADACEAALEDIRSSGDLAALNASYVDYTLILFPSSRYIEAHDLIESCFKFMLENSLDQYAQLSLPLWILRLGRPLSLLYAGQFGPALELFQSGVAAFLDNGDMARAATLRLYEAFCHLHMHNHETALRLCDEAIGFTDTTGRTKMSPNERQIEMVVRGLAELAAGRAERAIDLLGSAGRVMDEVRTLTTWHWRLALEWGLTDAHLAVGDLGEAHRHAERFMQRALATNERTWRTLAHEASARVAMRENDHSGASVHIGAARAEAAAGPVPLAEWRLDVVEGHLLEKMGDLGGARIRLDQARGRIDGLGDSQMLSQEACNSLKGAGPIM
jgi:DNA-binding winged helix-turn-helix (wHTH) protein/tetratricopeptide (TPR) repeat protein